MGKAVIVSEQGEGLYTVRKEVTGLEQARLLIAEQREKLERENPEWRDAVAQIWDEVQSMRQTVNAMILDWESTAFDPLADLPTNPNEPSAADKQEVVRLVNEERTQRGLDPLTANEVLADAAQDHADWMESNTYGHSGPDGNTPADRVKAAGYDPSMAAENLAAGQKTPAEVVAAWMASPGHRANILNPDLKEIGIGGGRHPEYGASWVQKFGTPA